MLKRSPSRRDFLKDSAILFGGAWLSTHGLAVQAAAKTAREALDGRTALANLAPAEARTLAALVDQVFPPDEDPASPGASELGAVQFIDAAIGGFMARAAALLHSGLADLDGRATSKQGAVFADLGFEQQTELVRQIENTAFFGTTHFLTLLGLFAMPRYGGNSDGGAWKMIGYESRHVWQAPYGYYDAQYAKEQDHASS
ncbi:MAG TPA: gluconate 2-dehydrogenase subunit 3 family protein [Xanthomonadales bacterium]|nr:gluconate 2-dehydrogenase subunit 3 family protein [Xanthomonadales bacterium]